MYRLWRLFLRRLRVRGQAVRGHVFRRLRVFRAVRALRRIEYFDFFGSVARRGRISLCVHCYLPTEIAGSEHGHADGEHNGEFGNKVHGLINERIKIFVGKQRHAVLVGKPLGVHAERIHARKIVTYKTEKARYARAQRELRAHIVFEQSKVANTARKPYRRERHGIIERELRGVDNPRILYRLQNSVYQADEHAPATAEHERKQHKRKHGRESNAPAHGHFKQSHIRQRKAQRHADGGESDRFCIEQAFAPVGEKRERDYSRCDERRAYVQPDIARRVARLAACVVCNHARKHANKRRAAHRRANYFDYRVRLEEQRRRACHNRDCEHEQGIKQYGYDRVAFDEITGRKRYNKTHRHEQRAHYPRAVYYARRLVYIRSAVRGFNRAPAKHCDIDLCDDERNDERDCNPQRDGAANVGSSVEIGEVVFDVV